jgi:recombination protein RecR
MTPDAIDHVVELLATLPTIGRKTARRLAFHLVRQPSDVVQRFADALVYMRKNVRECTECCTFTDREMCHICASDKRDRTTICVVENPSDVLAVERTNEYRGLYHVLHGTLNPLDNVGPDDIRLRELMRRLHGVEELILALNPNVEGEVTSHYIARQVSPLEITVSRIARGLPMGSDLEFADDATLARALEGRTAL